MTKISLVTPSVGELNTAAEPKVTTALKEVEKFLNEQKIESTDNIKPEGIAEASLSKALQEKLTTRVGMTLVKKNESFEGVTENFYLMEKEGSTLTLPVATLNRMIGAQCSANIAVVKMKVTAGGIFGDFLQGGEAGQAEVELRKGQHLIVLADGSNWRIIAGEPKREQKYGVGVTRSKAEAEAGVEPSVTRPAYVILRPKASGEITVGGISLTAESGTGTWPIWVNPGQAWKANVEIQSSTLLL